MKTKMLILVAGLLAMPMAKADLYVELGAESGGDELISTTSGDNLYTGGGVKLAAGFQNQINDGDASIRLTLGYLSDSVDAINGYADTDTVTFDALYLFNSGPHSFGFGPTVHIKPTYRDNVAGYPPLKIEFEDAVGVMFQYGYKIFPGFEIGARVTNIEYVNQSTRLDASSFGVYLSNGF